MLLISRPIIKTTHLTSSQGALPHYLWLLDVIIPVHHNHDQKLGFTDGSLTDIHNLAAGLLPSIVAIYFRPLPIYMARSINIYVPRVCISKEQSKKAKDFLHRQNAQIHGQNAKIYHNVLRLTPFSSPNSLPLSPSPSLSPLVPPSSPLPPFSFLPTQPPA
jgi:hypothetical protein